MTRRFSLWKLHLTMILSPRDPAGDSKMFRSENIAEVEGLVSRKTWKVMKIQRLQKDANILGGRFVRIIMEFGTQSETPKALYVAQGHLHKNKEFFLHNTTKLRQLSICVIPSYAAVNVYRGFSQDFEQAFHKSDEELTRKVYIAPQKRDLIFSRYLLLTMYWIC